MTMLDDSGGVDLGLVDDARNGRREAFAELFRRHHDAAVRFATALTRGDEAKGQDLVAEAFVKVWRAIAGGGGSVVSFRSYLLTAVRHEYLAELRRTGRVDLVEDVSTLDSAARAGDGDPDEGDVVVGDAFRSLPDRWRAVLWHTEIEGDRPAEIAGSMGMSANAVAALASRAREGLRQEYLQRQVSITNPGCIPYASKLGRLVRGALPRRDVRRLEDHLVRCRTCRQERDHLSALNGKMRSVLPLLVAAAPHWPAFGGHAGQAGMALAGTAGAATGGAVTSGIATGGSVAGAVATTSGAVTATAAAGTAVSAAACAGGLSGIGAAAGMAMASVAAVLGVSAVASSAPSPDDVAPVSIVRDAGDEDVPAVEMTDGEAGAAPYADDTADASPDSEDTSGGPLEPTPDGATTPASTVTSTPAASTPAASTPGIPAPNSAPLVEGTAPSTGPSSTESTSPTEVASASDPSASDSSSSVSSEPSSPPGDSGTASKDERDDSATPGFRPTGPGGSTPGASTPAPSSSAAPPAHSSDSDRPGRGLGRSSAGPNSSDASARGGRPADVAAGDATFEQGERRGGGVGAPGR